MLYGGCVFHCYGKRVRVVGGGFAGDFHILLWCIVYFGNNISDSSIMNTYNNSDNFYNQSRKADHESRDNQYNIRN